MIFLGHFGEIKPTETHHDVSKLQLLLFFLKNCFGSFSSAADMNQIFIVS